MGRTVSRGARWKARGRIKLTDTSNAAKHDGSRLADAEWERVSDMEDAKESRVHPGSHGARGSGVAVFVVIRHTAPPTRYRYPFGLPIRYVPESSISSRPFPPPDCFRSLWSERAMLQYNVVACTVPVCSTAPILRCAHCGEMAHCRNATCAQALTCGAHQPARWMPGSVLRVTSACSCRTQFSGGCLFTQSL